MPKRTVLDPQGVTVKNAIHHLGMDCVEEARVGKSIELKIAGEDIDQTREKLEAIAKDLLSNPVIEDFEIKMEKI